MAKLGDRIKRSKKMFLNSDEKKGKEDGPLCSHGITGTGLNSSHTASEQEQGQETTLMGHGCQGVRMAPPRRGRQTQASHLTLGRLSGPQRRRGHPAEPELSLTWGKHGLCVLSRACFPASLCLTIPVGQSSGKWGDGGRWEGWVHTPGVFRGLASRRGYHREHKVRKPPMPGRELPESHQWEPIRPTYFCSHLKDRRGSSTGEVAVCLEDVAWAMAEFTPRLPAGLDSPQQHKPQKDQIDSQ